MSKPEPLLSFENYLERNLKNEIKLNILFYLLLLAQFSPTHKIKFDRI
jgi:hypothetical protein